jgi:hypothetical protein
VLSRDEYTRAIHAFLGELSGKLIGESSSKLQQIPGLKDEASEALAVLRDPTTTLNVVLATALGLIDEYVSRAGPEPLDEAYEFYVDQHGSRSSRSSASE